MKTVIVYHDQHPMFFWDENNSHKSIFQEAARGTVIDESLNDDDICGICFETTNSITAHWSKTLKNYPSIDFKTTSSTHRSTSVGDIVCIVDEQNNKTFYGCANIGWEKISSPQHLQFEEQSQQNSQKISGGRS